MVNDDYLKRSGMDLRPVHRVDNLAMALIASTKGAALLPAYAKKSVTSRPLDGEAPTIDLVIGYKRPTPRQFSACSFRASIS
jgi:LysR family transcriptional regulator, hca operon transcriptional activator